MHRQSYARAPTLGLPAITGLVCVPVGQHRRDGVVLVAGSVGNYVRFFRTKEQRACDAPPPRWEKSSPP